MSGSSSDLAPRSLTLRGAPRWVHAVLAATVAIVAAYGISILPGLPGRPGTIPFWETWVRSAAYAGAVALCAARAILVPAERRAWSALAAAVASYMAGYVGFGIVYSDGDVPYVSFADAFWLGFYPLSWIAHQRRLDIVCDHRAANRLQQDEGQPAALDLLVLRHQRHQGVGIRKPFLGEARNVLQMGRQPDGSQVALDAGGIGLGNHAELGGKLRRQHHADGDAFAVEQAIGKAGRGFQRVAEGVTEIEQCALAVLAFVAHHDRRLGAAGGGDGVLARAAADEEDFHAR